MLFSGNGMMNIYISYRSGWQKLWGQ